jgi:hypothetical protein
MVFLLQGRAEHAVERLTRLHDAFRGSLTTARVVTRIFDRGRYVFRNVREDETLLKDESYSLSGIQVRATSHAEQRGLFSSTTGQEFLLSNDRKMLEQMIQAQTSERVTYALAAGSFSPPSLASFLGGRLPTVLNPPSPLLLKETDTFDWSLTRQGDVATLTFTRAF